MMKGFFLLALTLCAAGGASAHPLGIFSVNRYAHVEVRRGEIRILYVMDVAEIPSTQEIAAIDRNHDGVIDDAEQHEYARAKIAGLIRGLDVSIDGCPATFDPGPGEIALPAGQGGLKTVRLSFLLRCAAPEDSADHLLKIHDSNFADGRGWKEIIATAGGGAAILRATVPDRDVTDELKNYPAERLADPLSVSEAEVEYRAGESFAGTGGAALSPGGGMVNRAKDAFAELVSARDLSPSVMLVSLLLAFALGAGHALTPGHGKTIVAAYLVGSRGTARHAAFLGLTVTATHTAGVFALGFIAMYASKYVLPEDLYPWLSLASGLIVLLIGLSLLRSRIRSARGGAGPHEETHGVEHAHAHRHGGIVHDHGTGMHTHLPPGSDGGPFTWQRLTALGVSGGLLPCPSALVVLLGAVALGRIGFGLLLIVAFSAGLAGVLTGIGLMMVYARRFFERFNTGGPLVRWLPVASAAIVSATGLVMSIQAAGLAGAGGAISAVTVTGLFSGTAFPVLALGFTLGLKHALDADHLVAVSTIVSGRRGILGSSIVGGLWGLGHTLSLMAVGLLVIALHVRIPEKVAQGMEFTVALMLVILGVNVLRTMKNARAHAHTHAHEFPAHPAGIVHSHGPLTALFREGIAGGKRSLLIGMVHGLAGSAALMLVVLSTIPSTPLAISYIGIFGFGSVGGMMLMSTILGLPFAFTARRFESLNSVIRGISGAVSVGFGLILAWQIGVMQGLFFRS
jgi:ABC-type nickel/cobalt efflux system permease component RcnA